MSGEGVGSGPEQVKPPVNPDNTGNTSVDSSKNQAEARRGENKAVRKVVRQFRNRTQPPMRHDLTRLRVLQQEKRAGADISISKQPSEQKSHHPQEGSVGGQTQERQSLPVQDSAAEANVPQNEKEEEKLSGFEPAPEPEAKKLSDAIADNPEHAASLFRNINPESDEGKKLDEEANDLMAKTYEERNKPEEEQDKAQLKQWEDRLQNIFSKGEAPVMEEEKPAPTHPDDEPGKEDESTGEQGGDTGGEEVPEAPVDENAPPAPREEEEELGTMRQEFEDITKQEKDGLISQEAAQEKAKNLLARLLGDKEKYQKGWRITKWAVYWAVVTTAIAYIWSLKTIGGGVAKAGGRK